MTWHDCLRYEPKEETQQIAMLSSGTVRLFIMTEGERRQTTHDSIDKLKVDIGKIVHTHRAFAS